MNLLIVLSNPNPDSFSAAVALRLAQGSSEGGHRSEIADLAREGFDPRMLARDLAAYRKEGALPDDVLREQERVDRADALALVFPVYWWSMPAALKGWIDRVFTGGWAYEIDEEGKAHGRLAERPVHLLAIGGADRAAYDKHGYRAAIDAQIERGIFHWCGLRDVRTHVLDDSEGTDDAVRARHLDTALRIGRDMFAARAAVA